MECRGPIPLAAPPTLVVANGHAVDHDFRGSRFGSTRSDGPETRVTAAQQELRPPIQTVALVATHQTFVYPFAMADTAKKRRKKKRRDQQDGEAPQPALSPESRPAEVATVLWMLTLLATLGAEVLLLIVGTILYYSKLPEDQPADIQPVNMMPGVLMFIASVAGLICLLLTPVVYRLRNVSPPKAITAVAIFAGALPLIAAAASMLGK